MFNVIIYVLAGFTLGRAAFWIYWKIKNWKKQWT